MKPYEPPKGGRYFRDLQTGRRVLAEGVEAVGHFVSSRQSAMGSRQSDNTTADPAAKPAGDEGKKTGKGK